MVKAQIPDTGIAAETNSPVNEFLRSAPTKNTIGVMGGPGKSTVATLISNILKAAGHEVFLATDSTSPLSFLGEIKEGSWVVLELSDTELARLQTPPSILLCLGVPAGNQAWQTNGALYMAASQLSGRQTSGASAIYFWDDALSKSIVRNGAGEKMPYYSEPGAVILENRVRIDNQDICPVSELKLYGEHNLQNICAALTSVWQITQNTEAIRLALTTFTGLPHRLEYLREIGGVHYFDDSSALAPTATIAALRAFMEPKVVIVGGTDTETPLAELAAEIKGNNVRQIVVVGDAGPKIIEALEAVEFTNIALGGNTMEEIVATCRSSSQPGDIVLFSPGFPRADGAKDYQESGEEFKTAVSKLA